MDEYRENVKKVQKALNQDAAFIQPNPYLAQRVLNAANGNRVCGVSMKHKLSLSMVIVIALLSVSLVASAVVVINTFIERAAMLQDEKGDMSHWTLEEKIDLIVSMKESGIDIPQELLDLLTSGGVSTEEANRIADRLIVEKKHSREALAEQYGFTRTTFSFFSTQVDFVEDKDDASASYWSVLYTPTDHKDRIGCYRVKINAVTQEVIAVEWEYDTEVASTAEVKGWYAEKWNAPLIDGLVTFDQQVQSRKSEWELTLGAFDTWTLQDKAEFDHIYLEFGYPYGDMPLNVLPEEGDLSAEEAISFAGVCIEDTYGIDPSTLSDYRVEQTLFKLENASEKLYIIEFHHQNGSEYYAVEFSSETQNVDLCAHYVNQVYVAPPLANNAETSTVDETIIPDGIIEIAQMALKEEFGLTDNALLFFDATVSVRADGWEITFESNTINPQVVGTYTVFYSQTGQCVEKTEWEFASIYPTQEKHTYWKDNNIWGPYEMNCFAQLRIATRGIVKEAGGENHLSFEQQAEYDRLYREAGYDRARYYHGIPGVGDIEFGDALSIAKEAVANRWSVPSDKLDDCEVLYEFDVSDPDQYVWRIRLLLDNGDKMYTVELDSETGEVLSMNISTGSNG